MNILLLGGSNVGLHFGWAAQLAAIAPEHRTTNRFLGAVGSLYGLSRLLENERENVPLPDLVIFEYALNDIVLLDAGCVRMNLLEDTLVDVVDFCGRHGIKLLFLCLEVRPTGRNRVSRCVARVKKLYARVARSHGTFPCFALEDIFGSIRRDLFLDEHHLTEDASRRVAEHLAAVIGQSSIPVPVAGRSKRRAFDFIPASRARTSGPCRLIEINSTVLSGTFLQIARSGASYWPGQGWLVGLLLRSTEATGVFRISVDGRHTRKNAQSKMREIVPKLILLHYLVSRPWAGRDFDIEIAMPANEAELMRLPVDRSPLEARSETPFMDQLLEINGIMVWRQSSLWEGWRGLIGAAIQNASWKGLASAVRGLFFHAPR